jgi:heptosyltransferase I
MAMPSQHIVLLRLSALGDCVHASALLHAIATQRPDWRISWILGPLEAKLMQGIDQLLPKVSLFVYHKKDGIAGMRTLVRTLRQSQGDIDVLLQLQLAFRANVLSLLIPAKRRIGYDWQRAKEGHALVTRERISPEAGPHVQDSFLGVLPLLGLAEPPLLQWPIHIPEQAHEFARLHLPEANRYLLISPCSSHALRNWRAQRYAELARYGLQKHGLHTVLVGGPSALEQQMGADIAHCMGDAPCLNLIGKDTLKQLAALLQRASVVLSPDSGPAHLAQALGTPVVGLYACTDAARSGPYRFRHLCTQRYQQAAQQFLKAGPRWGQRVEFDGVMDLISVAEVQTLLDQALQARVAQDA